MTTIYSTPTSLQRLDADSAFDEAQLAAAAFLARYSGRTLDAYRHDLRGFFQWSADVGLTVLAATDPTSSSTRGWMDDRGLAASTIDRRLSTVCGYYRFAHIDGRIPSNPAQYVRRPNVQPSEGHGMDRGELGTFLFTAERFDHSHAALAVLLGLNGLRVSDACGTNVEDLGIQRGHRTLRILGKGNKPALIPLVPRAARTIDLAVGERHEGPSSAATTASASTAAPRIDGCDPSASEPGWAPCTHIYVARRVHHDGPGRGSPSTRCADRRASRRSPARRPSMTAVERTSTATQRTS